MMTPQLLIQAMITFGLALHFRHFRQSHVDGKQVTRKISRQL